MKMKRDKYLVPSLKSFDLKKVPTSISKLYKSKKNYHKLLDKQVEELRCLQQVHYASDRYSLLLIFQGMDAAGKDGAIRHVMSGVNPQGCQVFSFQHPSVGELQHDFLWRTTCNLPERGRIGIFNRSYYEEVLIARVHPEILRSQGIPKELVDEKTVWKERFQSIVDFEAHLNRNGTRIIKFYLHESKDEQKKRFLKRIDDPQKNWKLTLADIKEREFWDEYIKAYEKCLANTSTKNSPWFVIPADNKKNARLIISSIIVDVLKDLKLEYPKSDSHHRKELESIRKELKND